MKTNTPLLIASATIAITMAAAPRGWATDGRWNKDANGTWSTASNWTNNQVPGGISAYADIEYNVTAARTITLNIPATAVVKGQSPKS